MKKAPEQRNVARLQQNEDFHVDERLARILDLQFDTGRAQPAQCRLLANDWKPLLQPARHAIALADIHEHACGEPADQHNYREEKQPAACFRRNHQEDDHFRLCRTVPRYYQNEASRGRSFSEVRLKEETFLDHLRDFFYGMTAWEFERHATEMRGALENVFLTVTLGDMLGLPLLPPIYSLRLLPYVVPSITTWKHRVSRKRELPESEEYDLHGM